MAILWFMPRLPGGSAGCASALGTTVSGRTGAIDVGDDVGVEARGLDQAGAILRL